MTEKTKLKDLTEEQIDEAVIEQTDNDDAWGEPVHVGAYDRELCLRMPVDLLRRMRLQAQKEGFSHVEDWVMYLLVMNLQTQFDPLLIKEHDSVYEVETQGGTTKRRRISEEARARMAEAQRKRWEKKEAKKN